MTDGNAGALKHWRHKKRGTAYTEVGTGSLQASDGVIGDGEFLVIYRSDTDGSLWARPFNEFHDGRFEALSPAPVERREAIAQVFLTGMHGKDTADTLRRNNGVAWNDVLRGVDAICASTFLKNREAIAQAIRGALVENWSCAELGTRWDEDVLLTGCKKVGSGKGYQNPEQAAQNLALDAADAILALPCPDEAAIRADEREKCAKRQGISLGDIVVVNENYQFHSDWRDMQLKVVGLHIEPNGTLWADVIEGSQRHRGNGRYDGETTDFYAPHLSVVEPAHAIRKGDAL